SQKNAMQVKSLAQRAGNLSNGCPHPVPTNNVVAEAWEGSCWLSCAGLWLLTADAHKERRSRSWWKRLVIAWVMTIYIGAAVFGDGRKANLIRIVHNQTLTTLLRPP